MENYMADQATPGHTANPGVQRLNTLLGRISAQADVAKALGILDTASQSEQFWTEQRRAARQRTYMLAQHRLKGDILAERMGLSVEEANLVADEVASMLDLESLSYSDVRQWFLQRGQCEQNRALNLRREQAMLASRGLRVLLLLNDGGAKYLAYGTHMHALHLVSDPAAAHAFPVHSTSELSPSALLAMAQDFEAVRVQFNAKQVKILVGARG
jgi:hypothetical protein